VLRHLKEILVHQQLFVTRRALSALWRLVARKRKKVTGMRCEKPTVVLAASAVDAVQGTGKIDDPMDSSQPTNAAYQADE
jgi:hypothetical protein